MPQLALLTEFVEDAIESGSISVGPGGQVLQTYTLEDGAEVFQTGDPEIDRMEQEFARKAIREIDQRKREGKFKSPSRDPSKPTFPWYDAETFDEDLLGSS